MGILFVGHGAPCREDENLLQIALYTREKGNQKSNELFEHVACSTSSVRSLREALVEPLMKWRKTDTSELVDRWPQDIVWQRLRLRDGQTGRQFAVLRDDRTLRSALPALGDGRQVAVQFLDADESLGPDDVLVSVRPWRVLEGRLHAPTELVVDKSQSLADFHAMLTSRFAGLLQTAEASPEGGPAELDSLQIVALPGGNSGPALTSQRCASLKWNESRLNPTSHEEQSSSLIECREFRDGATFIVRSQLAAAAASERGANAEPSDGVADATSVKAKADPKPSARSAAKSGARRPPVFSLAAPARKERSLHIEVLCPDEGHDACTSEDPNS